MKKTITQNGMILGGLLAASFLVFYFIDPKLVHKVGIYFALTILIPIFFIRKGILEEREQNEGNISFGEAMSVGFPIYVIGSLILTLVTAVIFYTSPEYTTSAIEVAKESVAQALEFMGQISDVDEEAKNTVLEEMNNSMPTISIWTIFLGYITSLVFPGAILALIISAVLKKS